MLPKKVTLVEVSPRDGLENLGREISVEFRVELIKRLLHSGLTVIDVGAFFSKQIILPLINTAEVLQRTQQDDARFICLVPDMKGFDEALKVGAKEITIFTGAAENFTQTYLECSIEESIRLSEKIIERAKKNKIKVRGAISLAFGSLEDVVEPITPAKIAKRLWEMGCHEIVLGDSPGLGNPKTVKLLIGLCLEQGIPVEKLALHFHNTYDLGLANIYAGLELGVSIVESSVGGLGGLGTSGNIATENLVAMLNELGIGTSINLDALIETGQYACHFLNKPYRGV